MQFNKKDQQRDAHTIKIVELKEKAYTSISFALFLSLQENYVLLHSMYKKKTIKKNVYFDK